MSNKFLTIFFILSSSYLFGQVKNNVPTEPKYPGGDSAMKAFINSRQKLYIKHENTNFKVECLISKEGKATFVSMSTNATDEDTVAIISEIKEIVSAMPVWIPARVNGTAVAKKTTIDFPYTPYYLSDKGSIVYDRDISDVAIIEREEHDSVRIYTYVEVMPEFPGGNKALMDFIRSNIIYPKQAIKDSIQGKVIVEFVIRRDGTVSDVKVLKGIGFGCNEEAMRVVKSMPVWKPGRHNGKTLNVSYRLPIKFKLN